MQEIIEEIMAYEPFTEQEAADKKLFLDKLQFQENLLTRENTDYHFSSSAWVINPSYDKVLMVYHNIYQSYSWTGGHADGCADLLFVAKKELEEETGIKDYQLIHEGLFAFDILPVQEHYKKGQLIKEHYHINTAYLLWQKRTRCCISRRMRTATSNGSMSPSWIKRSLKKRCGLITIK